MSDVSLEEKTYEILSLFITTICTQSLVLPGESWIHGIAIASTRLLGDIDLDWSSESVFRLCLVMSHAKVKTDDEKKRGQCLEGYETM